MKKKLTLRKRTLAVLNPEEAEAAAGGDRGGTVPHTERATCPPSCPPTCADTCADTCAATCANTCAHTCCC